MNKESYESPLLTYLTEQLSWVQSSHLRAIIEIKRGILLARTSRSVENATLSTSIRDRFRGHEDPEIFSMLWIFEAVADFYQSGTTSGRSGLEKAFVLARSSNHPGVAEYAACWAAHFSFTNDAYQDMIRWLKLSKLDRAELPEAACRASLVLALAWQTSGHNSFAAHWFGRSRDIARHIGDRATIMATTANRAAIRLNDCWINHWFGVKGSIVLSEVSAEALGALAYERVTKSEALYRQALITRARLKVLKGEYREALILLSELVVDTNFKHSIERASIYLIAWLRLKLGESVKNQEMLLSDENGISLLEVDDRAVSLKILSIIATAIGNQELARNFIQRGNQEFERFELSKRSLGEALHVGFSS